MGVARRYTQYCVPGAPCIATRVYSEEALRVSIHWLYSGMHSWIVVYETEAKINVNCTGTGLGDQLRPRPLLV